MKKAAEMLSVGRGPSHHQKNAVAEGLNSNATVQKWVCVYRNPNHFKIAVYFHCGGLNLHPATLTHRKVG